MPDPYDRHARDSERGWHNQPPRSQQRQQAAAEPQARRPPRKKDRSLCKDAHWKGPHKPVLRKRRPVWSKADTGCRWGTSWCHTDEPLWVCYHEEICDGCKKILRSRVTDTECPDYKPLTEAERDEIKAKIAANNLRTAELRNRRPLKLPITGPQGYRRKRQ